MEALVIILIIAWAVKHSAGEGHLGWQSAKAANRAGTRGQPVRKRAASAVQHDAGYWAHQFLNGFPQARRGLADGWHAGRTAQAQGIAARQKARAEHLSLRATLLPQIREHQRRQAEALEQIRAARQPEPGAPQEDTGEAASTRRVDGKPETAADTRFFDTRESGYTGPIDQDGYPVPGLPHPGPGQSRPAPSTTEGSAPMPAAADTTYTQQLAELTAIRQDAEAEVHSVQRKRMASRLDILMSLGLDSASLSEAAAIDDALQAQEKAAQQVLDAADAAIQGLRQRHGGIQEAVSNAPIAQPAQPGFYAD